MCVFLFRVCVSFLSVPVSCRVCLYMRVICCVRVSSPFVVFCVFGCAMLLMFENRVKSDAFAYD